MAYVLDVSSSRIIHDLLLSTDDNRGQNLGWTGIIRVDGKPFVWMGAPENIGPAVEQLDFEYTSTKSAFSMNVDGKIMMKITFLSPIHPSDYKRQSLPFSYMQVEIWPLDDHLHDVQLYTDISAGKKNPKSRVFGSSSLYS